MLEPGATVDPDRSTRSDRKLPMRIQSTTTAQPVGLFEPGPVRGANQSIPGSRRGAPSLRQGWTKPEPTTNMNPVLGLTHGWYKEVNPVTGLGGNVPWAILDNEC